MTDLSTEPVPVLKDVIDEFDPSTDALFAEMKQQTETREKQHIPLTEPVKTKEEEKEDAGSSKIKLSAELSADIFLGVADIIQQQVFRPLHGAKHKRRMRKLYGDDALEKCSALLDQIAKEDHQGHINERTPDEVGMLRLVKRYREVVEDIPFTEDEKDKIRPALVAYLKERGGELPPWLGLVMMSIEVFGPRITDLVVE